VAAVLLPLSGLGAGACQEAFHLWTEDRPATLGRCLRTALRRGVNHVTAEAMVLALPLIRRGQHPPRRPVGPPDRLPAV
jgi:hypothetical protein